MKPNSTPSTAPQGMRPLTAEQLKKSVGGATLTVGPRSVPVKVTFLQRS